ncbi:MAG: nucleotidyltransferase domain-containing protein [Flavobacterium sp.]
MENANLNEEQKIFFKNLSIFIDEDLFFYGSVKRCDYFPGKSDIDVDIFTDNEAKTARLLTNYLHLERSKVKKIVYKIDNKMIYGHKVAHTDNNTNIEFFIYNTKYKHIIMKDHTQFNELTIYGTIMMVILKCMYYYLPIMSTDTYKQLKKWLINPNTEPRFIQVDN